MSYNNIKSARRPLKGVQIMINIKHDDFNRNYDLFARLCEITSEPLKITKDGMPDLIVINAETYMRRKKMLDLREKLLRINEDEPFEEKGVTFAELEQYLNEIEKSVEK